MFTNDIQQQALAVMQDLGLVNCGVYGVFYSGVLHLMCCHTDEKGGLVQDAYPLPFGESEKVLQVAAVEHWQDELRQRLRGSDGAF